MGKDEFIALLNSELSNSEICERTIFSDEAWLIKQLHLENHREKYIEFKLFFANFFGVAPRNICLVGSGKTGFSLTPENNLRDFDNEKSDLDLIIVSSELFEKFWSTLLNGHYNWNLKLWEGHKSNVFRRFVSFKPFIEKEIQEIRDWNVKMGELQSSVYVNFDISTTVNYRIYRDWDSAHLYHCNGIEALRRLYATK